MEHARRALAASALAAMGTAFAQTAEELERYRRMTTFAFGASVLVNHEPYRGVNSGDPDVFVIPFYVYNKNNLTLAGPNISYRFWRPLDVQLSVEGKYRFQNYEGSDSPFLEGMDDRHGTFEVGLRAQKRIDRLRLRAEAYVDAASQHDGYELTLRANYELGDNRAYSVRPELGFSYQSSNLVTYYYGVKDDEARMAVPDGTGNLMDRPAYIPEPGVVPFAGVEFRVRLSRRLQLNGLVRSTFLSDEITESPIVSRPQRGSAFVGISYLFAGPGVSGGGRDRSR